MAPDDDGGPDDVVRRPPPWRRGGPPAPGPSPASTPSSQVVPEDGGDVAAALAAHLSASFAQETRRERDERPIDPADLQRARRRLCVSPVVLSVASLAVALLLVRSEVVEATFVLALLLISLTTCTVIRIVRVARLLGALSGRTLVLADGWAYDWRTDPQSSVGGGAFNGVVFPGLVLGSYLLGGYLVDGRKRLVLRSPVTGQFTIETGSLADVVQSPIWVPPGEEPRVVYAARSKRLLGIRLLD